MSEQLDDHNDLDQEDAVAFAPHSATDKRRSGDWQSRYPDPEAQKGIRFEASYLAVILFGIPLLLAILWLEYPNRILHLASQQYAALNRFSFAWLGGTLGGCLFSIKWLYHSVANEIWNVDRRLWRLFTPHVGGCLGFVFTLLVTSEAIPAIDGSFLDSYSLIVGLAFLVGYFADMAVAKLADIATTLFGSTASTTDSHTKHTKGKTHRKH